MKLTERELQNGSLMVKELASGATPQEISRLRRWTQNAPQYHQAYNLLRHKDNWEALDGARAEIDLDKEWKALRKARRSFFRPRRRRGLRVFLFCLVLLAALAAAAFFLLPTYFPNL